MSFREMTENSFEELLALELALCRIPAPSGRERARAEFILDLLSPLGAAHIDGADNVVFDAFDDGGADALLICAHTDTVFPDLTPFEPELREDRLYCPGAGDDTANLAAMLLLIRYLVLSGARPKRPVIFAANSGEEGLGNLRGCRELVDAYGERLGGLISLDGSWLSLTNDAVGSCRCRVTVKTPGGHSWYSFGSRSAAAALAELITELYAVEVPTKARTTYNVGVIGGGTSVNTIAQEASLLYEYRSADADCLAFMRRRFEEILARNREKPDTEVFCETLGLRPCRGVVDEARQKKLEDEARRAVFRVTGKTELPADAGSTDCNIPLSRGIPAVCFGLYLGGRSHTREEYVELGSLPVGMRIGAALMEEYFAVD